MKEYRLFRSTGDAVMLQHPDCADAIADGNTMSQALKVMRELETRMGLLHIQDQLIEQVLIEMSVPAI